MTLFYELTMPAVGNSDQEMKDIIPLRGGSERIIGAGALSHCGAFVSIAHGVVGISPIVVEYVAW